jgi:hypothetical protein
VSGESQNATDKPSCAAKRRLRRLLYLMAVAVGLLLAAGAVLRPVSGRQGGTLFLPLASRQHRVDVGALGVQIYNSNPNVVARVVGSGAQWIHIPFHWDWVEPVTDVTSYQWPVWYDDLLREYPAHGVEVILTLGYNPGWAATYPNGPIDKAPVGVLAEFMSAAVQHYGAPELNVRYWEFYNEPDNGFDGCAPLPPDGTACSVWGHEGDRYAQMLQAVYPAMKAAKPDVLVTLGGLAYDRWESEGGPFVEKFLDDVLANGGGRYLDVANFHYYPIFAPKWAPYGQGLIGKAAYLRTKMAQFGVHKPIICTETSMWSASPYGGSDAEQRRYVPQAFGRALAAHLAVTIWFMLTDDDTNPTKYGLLYSDLAPKPAYSAYQVMAQQLGAVAYLRTLAGSSPDVEAYEFMRAGGAGRVAVAWSNRAGSYEVVLPGSQVEVLDIDGNSTVLYDDDGDGMVHVPLGLDPVYARY